MAFQDLSKQIAAAASLDKVAPGKPLDAAYAAGRAFQELSGKALITIRNEFQQGVAQSKAALNSIFESPIVKRLGGRFRALVGRAATLREKVLTKIQTIATEQKEGWKQSLIGIKEGTQGLPAEFKKTRIAITQRVKNRLCARAIKKQEQLLAHCESRDIKKAISKVVRLPLSGKRGLDIDSRLLLQRHMASRMKRIREFNTGGNLKNTKDHLRTFLAELRDIQKNPHQAVIRLLAKNQKADMQSEL